MNKTRSFLATAAVIAAPLAFVSADQLPRNAKPLIEIVESLEREGYGPFSEISIDDGVWEAEVYQQNVPYELGIDACSGRTLSKYRDAAEPSPPGAGLPLSAVLRKLSKAGYGNIVDISFEHHSWEIEAHGPDGQHEIRVDPKTGKILKDRLDN